MRVLAALLAISVLAGCSAPAADEPGPSSAPYTPRQGHPAPGSGADEPPHQDITILQAPIQVVVPQAQPVSYGADIPANTTHVTFLFVSSPAFEISDLKVSLDGCGDYAQGLGLIGGAGGTSSFSGSLCETPAVGHHTVTVSATAAIINGTFYLNGWQPENGTKAPTA
jgi:hypothetical protein